jgi:hypothetical protein
MMQVRGEILCIVDLYECFTTMTVRSDLEYDGQKGKRELSLGDYSPGRYALLTRNLRVLRKPVPCRGQQAVPWQVPPEVEAEVRRQLP